MKSLYQILISFLIVQPAFGTDYEGVITKVRSKLAVIDSRTQKKLILTYRNEDIQKQLKRLEPNDFVSFDGVRSSTEATMRIDSVNYVGLKTLLGRWNGNDGFCYEFTTYTEMSVFVKSQDKCDFNGKGTLNARYMTYTVNPTTAGWLALISDESSSYAGEIDIKSVRRIDLSLYDSESGDILKKIILKK